MSGRRVCAVVLVMLAGSAGAAVAAKGASPSRLPYAVAVSARWGDEAGSEAFRSDLEKRLEAELVERCFTRVEPAGDAPAGSDVDLLLTVTLTNVVDETLFDDTIAKALTPGEPAEELRREARFAVDVAATLLTSVTRTEVGTHRLHADAVRRPVMIGEDPQAAARSQAIERIVGDLRKALCGGATADRRIAKALEAEGRPAPAR